MFFRSIYCWFLLAALTLAACGGGGGGGNSQPPIRQNLPPTVSAGQDQAVLASTTVNLNASATDSDGTIISYSWTQTAGDTVNLSNPDSANTSFVMPSNPTATAFSFTVTVTDNDGASASDTVTVTLHPAPIVDAGDNQTALISSTVSLTGTATSSSGTIVTYSWEQTAGEEVTLTASNSATASFTAPSSPENMAFTLTVTDNLGAQAEDSVAINVVNSLTDITGKVTFDLVPFNTASNGLDYDNTLVSPARGVLVEALDAQGNQIESTLTDGNGNYILSPTPDTQMRIRISAHMIQTTGAKWDTKVTDNTNNNALYVTQGELFNSTSNGSVRNFHLASGWDGAGYSQTRAAGPFAILDAIYEIIQKLVAVDPSIELPALEVRWSPNNSTADGDSENGDIGTSFYSSGTIYLLGKADSDSDEYDRHIVIHEWGHYFEDKLSRSDSIGGPHGYGERLDFRVAFGEGWGNAISAMITDDSFYRDSSGSQQATGWSMDINDNSTLNTGWFNEDSVHSTLYDIYDDDNEAGDNLALGLGPIYSILTDSNYRNLSYYTSIYPFIDRLKTQYPESASAINNLVSAQQIDGTSDNGLNESNNGGISSALPVYKTATIDGEAIQICSVNDAGTYNKLGNTAFITFNITSPGSYTFTVSESGGPTQTDPDFWLFKDGSYISRSESEEVGTETLTTNLTATGTYQMEVYDWNNYDDTENAGDYCFDLQIAN